MLTREDIYWGFFWKMSQEKARWLLTFLASEVYGVIIGAEKCSLFSPTCLGELYNSNNQWIIAIKGTLSWDEKIITFVHELVHMSFLRYEINHNEEMVDTLVERFLVVHRGYKIAEKLLLRHINYEQESTAYSPTPPVQGLAPIGWYFFESFIFELNRERDRRWAREAEEEQKRLKQERKQKRVEGKRRKMGQKL